MFRFLALVCICIIISSCGAEKKEFPQTDIAPPLKAGSWIFKLDLGQEELPITVVVRNEAGLKVDFINSDETLTAYEFIESGDSLYLKMPLFDSEFHGKVGKGRTTYSGVWKNYNKGADYEIPFSAQYGIEHRFCETNSTIPPMNFPNRFKVDFSPESEKNHYPAIGLFETTPNSNRITGTFATETGDYRYLEGNFCDGQLKLSCFDGSHAFLFKADYQNGALTNGMFKSGTHWTEPWVAYPDKDFELRDPDSLTQVVDSAAIWNTTFYDFEGNKKTLSDLDLKGKVSIVQILGTWCPNCVDETNSYAQLYTRYHEQGLEIVPLAFEKTASPIEGQTILSEFQKDLNVPYPLYYAGKRGKSATSSAIPALNHIMSYPTSIFIGRDGNVKKVHTGFYGPGTGIYYDTWLHETEMLIDTLLKQP